MRKWLPAILLGTLLLTACPKTSLEFENSSVLSNGFITPNATVSEAPDAWNTFRAGIEKDTFSQCDALRTNLDNNGLKGFKQDDINRLIDHCDALKFSIGDPRLPILDAHNCSGRCS